MAVGIIMLDNGDVISRSIYSGYNETTRSRGSIARYSNDYYWVAKAGDTYQLLYKLTDYEIQRAALRHIW